MFRKILSVLLAIITGFVTFSLFQNHVAQSYPPPADLQMVDKDGLEIYFKSLPNKAFFLMTAGHVLGSFVAAFVASALGNSHKFYLGLLGMGALTVAAISYIFAIITPDWMVVADPLLCVLFGLLGAYIGSKLSVIRK